MGVDDFHREFIEGLLGSSPTYVTLLLGVAWAVATYEKHPPISRWVMLGCIWLILVYLASSIWWWLVFPEFFPRNPALAHARIISYVVLSCSESLGFLFLLRAAFSYRFSMRPRRFFEVDFDDERPSKRIDDRMNDGRPTLPDDRA